MSTNLKQAIQGANMPLGKAGLVAGTTTTYSIGTAFYFMIDGVIPAQKGTATNAATPTTDKVTGKAFNPLVADQSCIFAFMVDSAGTVAVAQGPIVKNSDITNGLQGASFPAIPDDQCLFGYLWARAGTTLVGTWTFGTNNLSGVTGMTYTFRDAGTPPSKPVTA